MLNGKSFLITGGTGSFGHAFVPMTLAKYNPHRLVIYSRDEIKQWEMAKIYDNDNRVRFFIGDVRDKDRLARALNGIDFVVHAAATKIVPTAEALTIFTDAGYYTSFYIPTLKIGEMTETELKQFATSILNQVARSRLCAVSADHELYEFVRYYFPDYDRLHWYPTNNFISYRIRSKKILSDPGVKVILFHVNSKDYR